jgi:polysaccharide deacetylase 2 family uncharacterized protein YibQ
MARKQTNRANKSKIPPALIVGGIFFLLISVIFLLIVNIKVDKLKQEYIKAKTENSVKEKIDFNVDEKLKTFLFDHEISRERLKLLSEQNIGGKLFVKYKMLVTESEYNLLKPALESFFRKNGFDFQENVDDIIFNQKNIVVEISIDILNLYQEKGIEEENKVTSKQTVDNRDNGKKEGDKKKLAIPDKVGSHNLAIILDDSGQNLELAKRVLSMKYPVVLSILPYTKHDKETAELSRKHNREFFLHQPMEPKSYPDTKPGEGAILLNMPVSVIEATIRENIKRLGGGVTGVNNHMGSAFTENEEKMKEALIEIKKYTNIFVDSHTTPNTVAYDICKKIDGLKCGISKRFIDNNADPEYIKNKIYEAVNFLSSQDVIIIGHLRNNTVEVLEKVLPELEKKGVKIVSISDVVR